ncbi:MAG: protein-methionine-sulfoxide reductase catalytic subunit MsrP [Gammaproteobacteria bacterium]|nr:protein-methionine-sulfoxide reductase catalytic subunit MsrP [Gammaproteobacteria bacterium]
MSLLINKPASIKSSEITDQALFRNRRKLLQASLALGLGQTIAGPGLSLAAEADNGFDTDEERTAKDIMTSYNNFYELGTQKGDPKKNAHYLLTDPWSVEIAGECEKPGVYNLEDILKPHAIEERVYRLRCVEAWSMVVPWQGFGLGELLKRFEPNSRAKYVAFETLNDPKRMPGVTSPVLDWPYVEGLRIDEAMHPLTMIATGCYGESLPGQCGAPLRLVVPWKYGYKSIKSIVKISFVEDQPPTSWNELQPQEYGFYSNVNPDVSHPRWSQAKERRLTTGGGLSALFKSKIDTLKFNGYAEQVASLYSGMDLKKFH